MNVLVIPESKGFFGENAWQEVEAWLLAGHDLPKDWSWSSVRSEVSVNELFYERFAEIKGVQLEPAGGRKILALEAARRDDRIRQLCPEDIGRLEDRIGRWLAKK